MKLFLVVVLLAFASADTIVSDNGVLPGNSFNSGQGVPIIVPSLNPQVFPGFQVPNGPIQSRSQFVVRTIQVLEPVPLPMQQSLSLTTMAPITQMRESSGVKGRSMQVRPNGPYITDLFLR